MTTARKRSAAGRLADGASMAVICLIVAVFYVAGVAAPYVVAAWDLADRLRGAAPKGGAWQAAGAGR